MNSFVFFLVRKRISDFSFYISVTKQHDNSSLSRNCKWTCSFIGPVSTMVAGMVKSSYDILWYFLLINNLINLGLLVHFLANLVNSLSILVFFSHFAIFFSGSYYFLLASNKKNGCPSLIILKTWFTFGGTI